MNKKVGIAIAIIGALLIILTTYSAIKPGQIKPVDNIRVPVQAKIMTGVGDVTTDDLNIFSNKNTINPNAITLSEIDPYISELSPGDIIFTHTEKYILSRLVPGKWKHAIIYIGTKEQIQELFDVNDTSYKKIIPYYKKGNEKLIIDSSFHGVDIRKYSKLSNLENETLLVSIAGFTVNKNISKIRNIVNYAIAQEGKKYDFDIITDNSDTIYCSELIYQSLKKANITINITDSFCGREFISPSNIIEYIIGQGTTTNEFEMVFFIEKENSTIIERTISQLKEQ